MKVLTIKDACCLLGLAALAPSSAFAVAGDAALAKILETSALWADSGHTYHACNITNVTTSNLLVKVDLLDNAGNTLLTSGAAPVTLSPGATSETSPFSIESYTGFARCRFTIAGGSADAVRANEMVFFSVGTYFQTFAISEAR